MCGRNETLALHLYLGIHLGERRMNSPVSGSSLAWPEHAAAASFTPRSAGWDASDVWLGARARGCDQFRHRAVGHAPTLSRAEIRGHPEARRRAAKSSVGRCGFSHRSAAKSPRDRCGEMRGAWIALRDRETRELYGRSCGADESGVGSVGGTSRSTFGSSGSLATGRYPRRFSARRGAERREAPSRNRDGDPMIRHGDLAGESLVCVC